MSYSSRVYRQRNAHTHDEGSQDAFFSKSDVDSPESANSMFQAKLAVNEPGDKYEKEADAVANAVADKGTGIVQKKKVGNIQRLSSSKDDEKLSTNDARMKKDKEIQQKPMKQEGKLGDKEEDKKVQKKDSSAKDEDKKKIQKAEDKKKDDEESKMKSGSIQKKQEGTGTAASPQLSSKIESSAGAGSRMAPQTLREMSSSFGVDFNEVRVHNDKDAESMNKELEALAFTHGQDIYFNNGKYDPDSTEGKKLLAHELTHVVQQSSE